MDGLSGGLMRDLSGRRLPQQSTGRAVGCVFCQTGLSGFDRQVTVGEFLAKRFRWRRRAPRVGSDQHRHDGQGEPLLNYLP
jgi:adenine C2-methylase RlmN of 23S rRNA A2503 and tRNA A37